MSQYNFGIGTIIAKRTDVAYQKPAFLGVVQDVSVEINQAIKELHGQNKMAVALAGAELKITAKAKFARIQATTLGNTIINATPQSGQTIMSEAEHGTIVANQVTVSHSATFVEDLGVFDAATMTQLKPVASAPAVGEYTVSAGVYTFNISETVTNVLIYYSYTTTGGNTLAMVNSQMGQIPSFSLSLQTTFAQYGVTTKMFLKLNAVSSSKLTLPFKNNDFTIHEMDMQAFQDAAGNIGTISTTE